MRNRHEARSQVIRGQTFGERFGKSVATFLKRDSTNEQCPSLDGTELLCRVTLAHVLERRVQK